jgi:hypothetical protein
MEKEAYSSIGDYVKIYPWYFNHTILVYYIKIIKWKYFENKYSLNVIRQNNNINCDLN